GTPIARIEVMDRPARSENASHRGRVRFGPIFRETFRAWIERDAFGRSAALSFFALFSLGPVLVVFMTGAGLLFEPGDVRRQIVGQFEVLMGHEQALAVDAMLGRAAFEMTGLLGRIIGIATFVVGK